VFGSTRSFRNRQLLLLMPFFAVAAAAGIASLLLRKDRKEDESEYFPTVAASRGGSAESRTVCDKVKSDEPRFNMAAGVDVVPTFEGMGLKQNLLRCIFEFGYEKPTAIQQRAIVPMTCGRDVIAQAQSGTGKTSMLSVAALQVVNVQSRDVQVLCLNHTRELAVQVSQRLQRDSIRLLPPPQTAKVISAIGDVISIQAHPCIGGKSIGEDIHRLEAGVHIVSGIPQHTGLPHLRHHDAGGS
jgi:ATP-dependent RNA helicase